MKFFAEPAVNRAESFMRLKVAILNKSREFSSSYDFEISLIF
jgi:hypothetical protein